MTAKSISIKGAGCKFGGCALKAVESYLGRSVHVPESGLRVEQSTLTVRQKSAAGIVVAASGEGPNGRKRRSRRRDSMSDKRQKTQLRLAFGEEGRSEAPQASGEGSETLTAKRMNESPANQ